MHSAVLKAEPSMSFTSKILGTRGLVFFRLTVPNNKINFADVVQGICAPLVGTTIVHMEQLFNADTATMSWTFTVSSIGYFFGAVVCGFIFDRINHELQFVIANFIEAVATAVAPFFTSLPLYITALFIQANSQAFIDAGKVRLLSKLD